MFARCLSWASKRGLVEGNPLERGGRLYRKAGPALRMSGPMTNNIAFLLAVASPQIHLAFMLAIWTGQRQGDLLRLPWSAYDGVKN